MKDRTGYTIHVGSFVRVKPYDWNGVKVPGYFAKVLDIYEEEGKERVELKRVDGGCAWAYPAECEVAECKRRRDGRPKAAWMRKLEGGRHG